MVFFESGNHVYIVEIKLITATLNVDRIAQSVQRILALSQAQAWPNVKVILALVFDSEREMQKLSQIKRNIAVYGDVVQVHEFLLSELEERFQYIE